VGHSDCKATCDKIEKSLLSEALFLQLGFLRKRRFGTTRALFSFSYRKALFAVIFGVQHFATPPMFEGGYAESHISKNRVRNLIIKTAQSETGLLKALRSERPVTD